MAEICEKLATNVDSRVPCDAKSRAARRRRIEMRRFSALASSPAVSEIEEKSARKRLKYSSKITGKDYRTAVAETSSPSKQNTTPGEGQATDSSAGPSYSRRIFESVPGFGVISVCGRSREMEDEVAVHPRFFRRPDSSGDFLHFFGVYDGHGGSHVATLCKEKLHRLLAVELESVSDPDNVSTEDWKRVMESSFRRMDEEVFNSCTCGNAFPCECERAGLASEIVGSTAVVGILGCNRIVVANCGDSRAVLSRGGRAIPLSIDHKPDRPDELTRVEAAGGRVIYLNGARVLGILAMSRAIGDKYLKPIVISEPETSITEIKPEDDFLILASDGLWDVLSNDLACEIVHRCLYGQNPAKAAARILNSDDAASIDVETSDSRCSLAASLLVRLALARNSRDNISVIVVDLKRSS